MFLLGIIVIVAGVWMPAYNLWGRLPKSQAADLRRWLRGWAMKGLAAPVLIWFVFNSDISERFPPLMGQIQAAPRGRATLEAFLDVATAGFFVPRVCLKFALPRQGGGMKGRRASGITRRK